MLVRIVLLVTLLGQGAAIAAQPAFLQADNRKERCAAIGGWIESIEKLGGPQTGGLRVGQIMQLAAPGYRAAIGKPYHQLSGAERSRIAAGLRECSKERWVQVVLARPFTLDRGSAEVVEWRAAFAKALFADMRQLPAPTGSAPPPVVAAASPLLPGPDIAQVLPPRPLYPGKRPCDQVIDLPPDWVGVVTLLQADPALDLRASIALDPEHQQVFRLQHEQIDGAKVWAIPPAKSGYRRIYVGVDSPSGANGRYELYLHRFNQKELFETAVGQTFGAQILAWLLTPGDRQVGTAEQAAVNALSTAIVSVLSGSDGATILADSFQSVLVGKVADDLRLGGWGSVPANIVISFLRSYRSSVRDFRTAPADWRPRIGMLNCLDGCTVELQRFTPLGGREDARPERVSGLSLWGRFDSFSYRKAAEEGTVFAPVCDALEPEVCQKHRSASSERGRFWQWYVAEKAAVAPEEYREIVESYNARCARADALTKSLAARSVAALGDPPEESRLFAFAPIEEQGAAATAGALIHNGRLEKFWLGGMWGYGMPGDQDYSVEIRERIRPSLLQIYQRKSRILSCHYKVSETAGRGYHYWYDTAPATPTQLREIYPYHPLLLIGPPRRSCPATLAEAQASPAGYLTRDEVRAHLR